MPKVIGYTPPWLSKPSPGAKIFSDPEPQSPASPSKRTSYFGNNDSTHASPGSSRRLIANRGTEVFTVVGNKIRWANLSRVKDDWDEQNHAHRGKDRKNSYRTLITPVYYQITQLIISPSGVFLAICTEHTVHVAVLPDSSRLADADNGALKLKTYQLGPTTHVIPESPLTSVLWHPLAAFTNATDCLVTVTSEAAVRVWEIDRSNHWSFEQPALSIDLRKLADGISSDQDFTPSGFGKNKGFSVDTFEMEVAAAGFGGRGTPDEDPWASMTLWTAMSNGDVYALCPLLPSKWMPTPTTIPSLSISTVSRVATTTGSDVDADERKAAEQQYEWVQEIDTQEPLADIGGSDADFDEIRYRPSNPSAIPRLQGPFELSAVDDLDFGEVTDIHVIAARLDEEALLSGEEDYELVSDGIQFTVLCLATTAGKVLISLELEGVSGQWLPKKGRGTFSVPMAEARDLELLDMVDCAADQSTTSDSWPSITADPTNIYDFFTIVSDHIQSYSLSDWASRVGIELGGDNEVDPGLHTRIALACNANICVGHDILTARTGDQTISALSAPVIIHDLNLGNMLLTHAGGQAQVAVFEIDSFKLSQSLSSLPVDPSASPLRNAAALSKVLEEELPEPVPIRSPYVPAETFYHNQMQPYDDLRHKLTVPRKSILTDKPLRLSPAVLDVMTLAHRAFSAQTSNVETAAAELFRKCERLKVELADQVKQISELADRLQHIGTGGANHVSNNMKFDARIIRAQERQKDLVNRYERLRRKTGRVGTTNQELSIKEQAWTEEIQRLDDTVEKNGTNHGVDDGLTQRYLQAQQIADDLLGQFRLLEKSIESEHQTPSKTGIENSDTAATRKHGFSVSSRLQRDSINEVMAMVERESAVIDAVMARLSNLNVAS